MSYQFDIGERGRKVSRFLGKVRRELQAAFEQERAARKLTQQQIANLIGVNRSVINRQLMGAENLTLRRVAELAWALGWEIVFELRRPTAAHGQNHFSTQAVSPTTTPDISSSVGSIQTKTSSGKIEQRAAA